MRFGHLAQRMFNTPLAIHPGKAEVVMGALAERLGITRVIRLDGREFDPSAMDDEGDEFLAPGGNPRSGYDMVGSVAVVPVEGTLVNKLGTLRPYSGMTGYDGIRQNVLAALADPKVKAIVLNVDSPGGEVSGCFDLVDTLHQVRGEKPIWAILTESAYSAGYAIASACDRVMVPRTGGTGSVGVIWMHMDWSKAIGEAGIKVTILQYGDRKADGHPEIPMSDEARALFQDEINTMGELFVETVARNRAMPASKVRETQAACYLGSKGVEVGFADAVMAPDAAFRALLETLG